MSLSSDKMNPKRVYRNEGMFYLGTHLKCGRTVTFILLTILTGVLQNIFHIYYTFF